MNNLYFYVLTIALTIFAIFFICIIVTRKEMKFSLCKNFPCELMISNKFKYYFMFIGGLSVSMLFIVYFLFGFRTGRLIGDTSGVFLFLSSLSLLVMMFTDVTETKRHSFAVTIFFIATIIGFSFHGIHLLQEPSKALCPAWIGIVYLVLAFGGTCFLFSPKLKTWWKLDISVDEKGESVYSRPNINYLAMGEWGFIVLHLIGIVFLLIGRFIA